MSEQTLQIVRYHATLGEEGEHRFIMGFGNPIQTLAQLREIKISKATVATAEGSPIASLVPTNLQQCGLETEVSPLEPIKVVEDLIGPEAQSTLVIVDATHELMHQPPEGEIDEFKLCMKIGFSNHPLIATLEEKTR